jgi:plasmid stability protein
VKNVTITLDEQTAAWVRVHAAEHGMSVSRLVGEMLARQMEASQAYNSAMRRFLAKKPFLRSAPGGAYLTRDQAHDRARLR